MSDWADEKAREFLQFVEPYSHDDREELESLAALLREVADNSPVRDDDHIAVSVQRGVLAEVRRVIRKIDQRHDGADSWCFVRDEILARLEKL